MKKYILIIVSFLLSNYGLGNSCDLTRNFERDHLLAKSIDDPKVEQGIINKINIYLYSAKTTTNDELTAGYTYIDGLVNPIPIITSSLPYNTTNFYIAAYGNDTCNGFSPANPWRTIAKLNTVTLEPGDSVFFHAGDTFTGQVNVSQSGTASSSITFTSYGIGAKPIISGAETFTGWIQEGNIWACKVTGTVRCLYINGTRAVSARIPNTGYYTIVHVNGRKTSIEAAELNTAIDYWVGGMARVRTNDYTWENRTITSSFHNTLNFTTAFTYPPRVDWGLYIDGLKILIDTTNEWYCDGDSIWYQPAAGVNPNTLNIQGIQTEHGITVSGSYVAIKNLEFNYQDSSAIQLAGNITGATISNNIIRYQNREGINCPNTTTSCHILTNTIRDCAQKGIFLNIANSDSIGENILNYIGMYAGYCREAGGEQENMTGINTQGGSLSYIYANTLDSIGYAGILFYGHNNLIKYNYINHAAQKLQDGGGIYCYSAYPSTTYNNIVRRNIVINMGSNYTDATPSSYTAEYANAIAIYLDGYTRKTLVDSNTVINSDRIGMFIQYSSDSNRVIANTFYRSGRVWSSNEFEYKMDITKEQYGGLIFQHNILYPRRGNRSTLLQNIIIKGNFRPFISDHNVMCVPYAAQPYSFRVYTMDKSSATSYTLAQWKAYSGLDTHSKGLYKTFSSAMDSIFYNPTNHDSTVTLGTTFHNLDGTVATSPFTLRPYCSVILIYDAAVTPKRLTPHH